MQIDLEPADVAKLKALVSDEIARQKQLITDNGEPNPGIAEVNQLNLIAIRLQIPDRIIKDDLENFPGDEVEQLREHIPNADRCVEPGCDGVIYQKNWV